MSMVLNTNLPSITVQRNIEKNSGVAQVAMQRLSSGLRINSARDDAAGLAIGTAMDSQVRGLNMAARNSNDAISLLQTADGGLDTISAVFQRMRELSVQAASDSYAASDRTQLNTEYQALNSEVTRIAGATAFNGQKVIDSAAGAFSFQVGANAGETLSVTTVDAKTYLATPGDITTSANATTALGALDTALQSLNTTRSTYGAALNRMDFTVQSLKVASENQTAARSRIMDADFAQETATFAKQQVLQQAGIAMLSQANQMPNQILSLLR